MARLPTLQKYIFREMGRTFFLSTIGLTGVLSTCGGVVTLIPLEGITAVQTLMLLGLVIPTCAAFTLPIAALFSATITYGRLAADNEFTATRSSGISTLVLFKPCLYLSLLSAAITFVFFNFLIPALTGQIRHFTRASVKAIMAQSLSRGRGIEFKNFRVFADEYHTYDVESGQGGGDFDALWLRDVAFIEFESPEEGVAEAADAAPGHEEIVRLGTGESALIKFDLAAQNPSVEGDLANIVFVDLQRNIVPNSRHQRVGPFEIPWAFRTRPRHLPLTKLLEYRRHPERVFEKVISRLKSAQKAVLAKLVFDDLHAALAGGGRYELQGGDLTVILRGAASQVQAQQRHGSVWVEIHDAQVVEQLTDHAYIYDAELARIELEFESVERFGLLIHLDGRIRMYRDSEPEKRLDLRSRLIGPVHVPASVAERFGSAEFAEARLWDRDVRYDLGPEIEYARKQLRKDRSRYLHQIYAEISVRLVYSLSVIVLAVLGAALGIIVRGGQVLVAFGISFLPTLFVILTTILGKSIAKGQGTLEIGLAIMWLGLAVVLVIDAIVFKKYLPR